ncbi:MAG TPA: hypothetical protein VK178_07275 [Opitutaceae bacterium]|nr:hypothetical protein [Opitutaceae bacterium]
MKVSAPETPDYGEAYREGYEADISTLPLRLAIEQAADQGGTYTDPTSGKTYDFSAYGTKQERNAQDIANQLQLLQGGADISRLLEKQRLQDEIGLLPQYNALNLQAQRDAYNASLDAGEAGMKRQYDQQLEYLPLFNKAQLASQKDAYDQSLDLSEQGTRRMTALQQELLPEINDLGLSEQKKAFDLSISAGRDADPLATKLRDELLAQVNGDLAMGGDLTPAQQRMAEQAVRTAQASRGNVLGPTASLSEAMSLMGYGDTLKQQRQAAAVSALGTKPLTANFSAQTAINPVMQNSSAQTGLQNTNPNFQATTTSGPNLAAANVNQGSIWNFTNQTAGQSGVNYNMDVWKTKNANAQQNASAMNGVIGTVAGAGLKAAFM